ncbi:nucleic-acid binding protein [Cacao swollen shoot Togo A virus]|uniref:Nucleic-acid binding protein n=1 Tax=Cacao swollen shoot Togo A virus TaxID=1960254 RepID=Q5TJ70_9VIRU|nr:nucleic-acid binding protein [Cacao swollen shoot Togo A virus]CAG70341.1 nucleic-acid binding protein [Cacao swollen shoot Togo A virus]
MTDSPSYQEALKEAEKVDPPAVGLTTSTGVTAVQGFRAVIKQNNVQICLLAAIADKLDDLVQDRKQARKEKAKEVAIPEDLITKLKGLSLQEKGEEKVTRKEEPKGKLVVFKDPYKILAAEKAKITPKIPKEKKEDKKDEPGQNSALSS